MIKNRKIILTINLIASFAILFGVLYSCTDDNNHAVAHEINLNANSSPTEEIVNIIENLPTEIEMQTELQTHEVFTEEITVEDTVPVITVPITTAPPTTIMPTTQPPTTTVPPTTQPVTTVPPVTTSPEPVKYIEAPRTDFIQFMFDNAIEIPGNKGKIEPPPKGRSLELQYGIVPLSETIPEPFEYFNNIILLGDSVTVGFNLFRKNIVFNGEAVLNGLHVIAVESYGIFNASRPISDSSVHPRIGGVQYYPEDIIAQIDAENVFICLGLNDTWLSINDYLTHYANLINRILQKSPDKKIVIMPVTPVVRGQTRLNNNKISEMNNALIEFAAHNGLAFVDYAAALRNGENFLYDELSSDNYCHLRVSAYNRLVEYLLYHPVKN